MSEIKEIYNGEILDVWGDDEFVTLNIFPVSISIPTEDWEGLKKDFLKVNKLKN